VTGQARPDYVEHLRDQLEFLQASGAAFDSGIEGEAKRLAVVVRVLLHDTASSKSLLGQMKLKERMSYLNTANEYNPHNLMNHTGLVSLQVTSGGPGIGEARYVAMLGDRPGPFRMSPFSHWWAETVIKVDNETWSRKDVVLQLANKEGGAHVDEKLTQRYQSLARDNAVGFLYVGKTETGEFEEPAEGDPVAASMRQIAWEMEMTLKRELPLRVTGF